MISSFPTSYPEGKLRRGCSRSVHIVDMAVAPGACDGTMPCVGEEKHPRSQRSLQSGKCVARRKPHRPVGEQQRFLDVNTGANKPVAEVAIRLGGSGE